jgi:hypothetical protein
LGYRPSSFEKEFLSAPIHSPPLWSPIRSFKKDEAIEELPVTEDRPVGRSESPAAKRRWELVEKTSEDTLRRGLEAQRAAAAMQARMPAGIKPRPFRPKLRIPISAR